MEYLHSVFTKKQIKILISAGVSLAIGLIIMLVCVRITSKLSSQQFAKRWAGDNSYAQVTAFFSELSGFDTDKAKELSYKIENQLKQDSISNPNEDGRLWVYAYSANGEASVSSSISSSTVKAIGVGGDFFLFHPFEILEGSFFGSTNVNKDLVVIDENTAWTLFGSNNVVGQEIEIGGVRHIVCGVIKKDEGRLNDIAGNDKPTIYMSYESLSVNGAASYINSYEALMPNPLTGYALTALSEQSPVSKDRFEVVENSERYHFTRLLKNIKNFGIRGMNGKGIVYPYWENIARGYEDYLTPVTVVTVILLVYSAAVLLILLYRMWKLRTIHFKEIKDFTERQIEKYRERKKREEKDEELN